MHLLAVLASWLMPAEVGRVASRLVRGRVEELDTQISHLNRFKAQMKKRLFVVDEIRQIFHCDDESVDGFFPPDFRFEAASDSFDKVVAYLTEAGASRAGLEHAVKRRVPKFDLAALCLADTLKLKAELSLWIARASYLGTRSEAVKKAYRGVDMRARVVELLEHRQTLRERQRWLESALDGGNPGQEAGKKTLEELIIVFLGSGSEEEFKDDWAAIGSPGVEAGLLGSLVDSVLHPLQEKIESQELPLVEHHLIFPPKKLLETRAECLEFQATAHHGQFILARERRERVALLELQLDCNFGSGIDQSVPDLDQADFLEQEVTRILSRNVWDRIDNAAERSEVCAELGALRANLELQEKVQWSLMGTTREAHALYRGLLIEELDNAKNVDLTSAIEWWLSSSEPDRGLAALEADRVSCKS